MQRFQYTYLLNLLWLLIPLAGLMVLYFRWQKKFESRSFKSPIINHIIPFKNKIQAWVKLGLFFLSLILLVIAIANPQIGVKGEKIKGQGLDIMLLLDVSNSMLAEDIQPNRISRSKYFIAKFLDKLKHDRVGLILFAGSSYSQVPLTIDFTSIKMSLPLIDPTSFPSQGTNIGEAVDMAGKALGLTDSKSKAIVIITDGEDHDQEANAAIETARKNGIKVFAIGVGEEQAAPIPLGNGQFKKDEDGNTVMTSFNRSMLENLASIGNGSFYHLGQQGNIEEDVIAELNKLEGKDFEEFDFSNFNSYFYWFALVVLFLLFIEFVIPTVDFNQFIKNITSISFLMLVSLSLSAQNSEEKQKKASRTLIRKGNSNYQNNNFEKAELNYRKALVVHPKSRTANFNLANTLYSQGKFQESIDYYEKFVDKTEDKLSRARTYHNLGNGYFKSNQLKEAIQAYENALKLNPVDMDTKYNLALAKKQQKNKGGGKNNQQQNQDKKDNKEGKDDKKDNSGAGQPQDKPQENKPDEKQGNKGMSKEQAQRLLEALKNQEQNTQNKMEAKKPKPENKKSEKDW
jgi:Ca-activated chloride channel family protein